MLHAKLLDCTLRDGAYLVDKTFGDETIKGLIAGLRDAKIDIIEMGFLQNEGFGPGKSIFKNAEDAKRFIPKEKADSYYAAFADVSRFNMNNLDVNDGKSFDIVRSCFFKAERQGALDAFKAVKEKGYLLSVQPVDAMGYSDTELIELIENVNMFEPYCFSIVDTFGSMYEDDLQRIFSIIDHNLIPTCRIGFHSHNNLQMSNALTQAFLKMSFGRREVIVDSTVSGLGRGAGNTPTELIAEYMVKKLGYHYDIDVLLDLIDNYIEPLRNKATWGYNTQMFLAGAYSAHVNNIAYLKEKNSIKSKDIRFILNDVDPTVRKRYHYDLLEDSYLKCMSSDIDDTKDLEALKKKMQGRTVLVVAPGISSRIEAEKVKRYIKENEAIVISIHSVPEEYGCDYVYFSNAIRYEKLRQSGKKLRAPLIITSNLETEVDNDNFLISFRSLYKCGWQHADNSTILLLRLLDKLNVKKIGIAGLDGYELDSSKANQYADTSLSKYFDEQSAISTNKEIKEMLIDFLATMNQDSTVEFVTRSRFEKVIMQ